MKPKKKNFFSKKKFKMADSKKAHFSKSPILEIFSRKVPKMHFLAVFELLSDSLTAIYIDLHRCPLHHSILLTRGPISEIFAKKFWELAILKNELFLSRPFWIFFFEKKKYFASFPWKSAQIYMVEWMGRNFDVFPGFQNIPCYA